MHPGKSAPKLQLMLKERRSLKRLIADKKSPRALVRRSRAILGCAEGKTNRAVAQEVGVTDLSVGKWRKHFLRHRLKGFAQERRGKRPQTIRLSSNERRHLEAWIRSSQSPGLALRSRVILQCAQGKTNIAVARGTGISKLTVGKLRGRFLVARLASLQRQRAGRHLAPLTLNREEHETLEMWSAYSSSAALARRAHVILSCALGRTNIAVAKEVGLSERAVGYIRRRFLEDRLDAITFGYELHVRRIGALAHTRTQ